MHDSANAAGLVIVVDVTPSETKRLSAKCATASLAF
jgi:hypothetical protein